MTELSVIISFPNRQADYLPRVLEALRTQSLARSEWEIVLIDSGSAKLSEPACDISWHPNTRHIIQEETCRVSALQRGIREASGDLLLFLEDNIVLDSHYLAEAIRIGKEWPRMGIWGAGNICLEFEVEPSRNVKEYLMGLYSRTTRTALWSNFFDCPEAIPIVSGLCARGAVASAFCRHSNTILTQVPNDLRRAIIDGRDDLIAYSACKMGMGMGIFPEMKQLYIMSTERVHINHLKTYAVARSFVRYLTMYKWRRENLPPNPRSLKGFVAAFKGFLLCHGVRRRLYVAELRSMLKVHRLIAENNQI